MTSERQPFDISLGQIIQSSLTNLHTSMPGQVLSFDSATQTASVQPCLQRKFEGQDDPVNLPVVNDVPVLFPGSGDWWLTFDIKADSYVWLVFSERSIDAWLDSGGVLDPAKARKFALSDCVALAGVNPDPTKLSGFAGDAMTIRNRDNDILIKVTDSEVRLEAGGGYVTINSSTGQVDANGNLTVDK